MIIDFSITFFYNLCLENLWDQAIRKRGVKHKNGTVNKKKLLSIKVFFYYLQVLSESSKKNLLSLIQRVKNQSPPPRPKMYFSSP